MGLWNKKPPEGSEDQSKADMELLLEKFNASLDERVAPLKTTVETLQSKWDAMEKAASAPPPPDTTPRNADGTPRELTAEEKRAALDTALATGNIQNAARFIERDVLDAMPADFADLKPAIREMFRNTEVARKMKPDYAEYCENCVDLAIAREARKAGLRRRQSGEFFLEDRSSGSSEPDSILNDPSLTWEDKNGKTLTARQQLDKLGIDPKKFEERIAKGVH